jgi:hypothetical protein
MDISTKIWIIGELVPELPDNLFPTHLHAVFYQQIVGQKSFPTAIMIVAEHLQGLRRNIGIHTISVAIIRGKIRRDSLKFFVEDTHKNSEFAFCRSFSCSNFKVYFDHFQQTCNFFCTVFREWPLVFT